MVGVQSAELKCIPPIGCLQHVAPPLTNPGKSVKNKSSCSEKETHVSPIHHLNTLEKASRFTAWCCLINAETDSWVPSSVSVTMTIKRLWQTAGCTDIAAHHRRKLAGELMTAAFQAHGSGLLCNRSEPSWLFNVHFDSLAPCEPETPSENQRVQTQA